jgi:hypothetical protein
MAEGKSNRGIAEQLVVSLPAVEKHITRIFSKLGIDAVDTEHRRVHAVLMTSGKTDARPRPTGLRPRPWGRRRHRGICEPITTVRSNGRPKYSTGSEAS